MEHILYLSLGSNLGNRLANLKAAINNLSPQITVKKKSGVYETPPWGIADQPEFLNQVVEAETYMEPGPLLKHLKRLERVLGREPGVENGPRLIDVDILLYDDLVLEQGDLVIPHPHLHERAFVLVPLAEVAGQVVHPTLNQTITELLATVDASGIRRHQGPRGIIAPDESEARND
jgi:2-amino-4-hydroxy-6-hydroxymethyldihydropteridine diphosphokinase